ncbi:hypothetical protein [Microbulbifer discodermiae]|uniref:hypothetical protein n=1 Tax=Microbulbifer sp. 2201CG32-9 TaxID=3232309 RepID=UPI00345C0B31
MARKYLSSSTLGVIRVCVEAKARNNDTNAIITQSTCEGTTNNASVSIEKLSPTNFSLSSFTASDFDTGFQDTSNILDAWKIQALTYKPQGFTLRRVWNEDAITFSSQQLGFHGITSAPYGLLASYQPPTVIDTEPFTRIYGSTSLYWVSDTTANELEFPYVNTYNAIAGGILYKKHAINFDFNTNENITFVVTYGGAYTTYINFNVPVASRNNANMGWYFPGYTVPDYFMDLEPAEKKVYFEDTFGNRGHFSFSRENRSDRFGPGYYKISVNNS